jgi:hypothetical protein
MPTGRPLTRMEKASPLRAAISGAPWALTGVLLGIDHIRDVNGRPLGERRAPAEARRDVVMELVACPYHDERHGRWMNRTALEPTMRYFSAVTAEVAGFYAALPAAPPSWARMLAAVLDQLSAPARYLVLEGRSEGPVPAELAAGHKLAAGYFGALTALLRHGASGIGVPLSPSPERFLEFVHQRGSLIGQVEACAGPVGNIATLTKVFLRGAGPSLAPPLTIDPNRVALAKVLAAQVRLGLVWEVLDEHTERRLLLDGPEPRRLASRTEYLADRLAGRAAELLARPAPSAPSLAAHLPDGLEDAALTEALRDLTAPVATPGQVSALRQVLDAGDSGVMLSPQERPWVAECLASLLYRYRLVVQAQWRFETVLRRVLGKAAEAGFALNSLLCPRPRALEWFEVLTGHSLQYAAGPAMEIAIRNHHREVPFP